MIKVIRRGHLPRVKCKNCGTLLEYTEDDVSRKFYPSIGTITCPECKCIVYVPDRKV